MAGTIITVAQQKGGAGKTTLTAHLAVAFKDAGKRVALVDIDPQQSLSNWFRLRQELYDDAEDGMVLSRTEGWRSRSEVDKLARGFDIVLVDTPPHAETETRVAVRGAHIAVVPCQPSPMDVWATYPVLELAQKEGTPALMVLNRVPARANLTDQMLADIKGLGASIARARLGNRILFASALAEGRGAAEARPLSIATQEVKRLSKEILRKVA